MIPAPVADYLGLAAAFLAAASTFTLLLTRRFRLEREALHEIGRFMRENPDLVRAGGDEFFERWVVVSYVCNSFGLTRSHYSRRVEDMKEFIVGSAMEAC